MTKVKYKDMDVDQKFIHDAIGTQWIKIIRWSALMGIGIWMILVPEGITLGSTVRASVYLVSLIWSLPTGIIFIGLSLPFFIKVLLNIKVMKGFTWVKQPGGHYVYNEKERTTGLQYLSNGNDKIAFNPSQNEVYVMKGYKKLGLNKYKKMLPNNTEFNCNDTYWAADSDGFSIVHKGLYVSNMTSEYKEDDLIVSAPDLAKKFRLKNYKSNWDNSIRRADRY